MRTATECICLLPRHISVMFHLLSRPEEMSRAWAKCIRLRAKLNNKVYKHTKGYFRSVTHS